jgi:hypothetical protein
MPTEQDLVIRLQELQAHLARRRRELRHEYPSGRRCHLCETAGCLADALWHLGHLVPAADMKGD